jgi:hypothetical protein
VPVPSVTSVRIQEQVKTVTPSHGSTFSGVTLPVKSGDGNTGDRVAPFCLQTNRQVSA